MGTEYLSYSEGPLPPKSPWELPEMPSESVPFLSHSLLSVDFPQEKKQLLLSGAGGFQSREQVLCCQRLGSQLERSRKERRLEVTPEARFHPE